ncbi:MAG: FAD/NAD(P)-binding protein [Sphaerochaeta sp.]
MIKEELMPCVGVITEITRETPDVKTFRVMGLDGKKLFPSKPGQCAMISAPGLGEAMISITSSPTKDYTEFSIKKAGTLTTWMHEAEVGQQIAVRGPYGKPFPVDEDFKGKNLLFIAGGIGLAPLFSVIDYCLDKPDDYGKINVIYGSRSKDDLVDYEKLLEMGKKKNCQVNLTIDREQEGWDGHVGFVPTYVKELNPDLSYTVVVCGPPIMIKFTLQGLEELGFKDTQVWTTMEMRMKCGVGKCGRCNIGDKYVCKDGPVFRFDELGQLPNEY